MLAQHPLHGFGMQRQRRRTQLGGEILLIFEVQPTVGGLVQIPGASRQLIQDVGLESGEVATGALKTVNQLIFPQAVNRARRG